MLERILGIVFPIYGIVAVGYFYGRVKKPDMAFANQLNMAIFVPALVFGALANKSFHITEYLPLLGATFVAVVGSGLAGWGVARMIGVAPRTFAPPMMFNNCGNLGLPLAVLAFGEQAIGFYRRFGFVRIGVRRGYYRSAAGREDAQQQTEVHHHQAMREPRKPRPDSASRRHTRWKPCSRPCCPKAFPARGFAALAVRRLRLLVSVQYTSPLCGSTASHSGRSIVVAPTRSAAWRVRIRMSA